MKGALAMLYTCIAVLYGVVTAAGIAHNMPVQTVTLDEACSMVWALLAGWSWGFAAFGRR